MKHEFVNIILRNEHRLMTLVVSLDLRIWMRMLFWVIAVRMRHIALFICSRVLMREDVGLWLWGEGGKGERKAGFGLCYSHAAYCHFYMFESLDVAGWGSWGWGGGGCWWGRRVSRPAPFAHINR